MWQKLPALESLHQAFSSAVSNIRHPLLLFVRLFWGYEFFQTGLGKLNHLENVAQFFASLGIPFPEFNAAFVGSLELTGGLLLMIGFGARYASIPLIAILSVAYLTDDWAALTSIVSDPEQFVNATPFPFLLASLLVLTFGAGALSVDGLVKWLRLRRRTSANDADGREVLAVPVHAVNRSRSR